MLPPSTSASLGLIAAVLVAGASGLPLKGLEASSSFKDLAHQTPPQLPSSLPIAGDSLPSELSPFTSTSITDSNAGDGDFVMEERRGGGGREDRQGKHGSGNEEGEGGRGRHGHGGKKGGKGNKDRRGKKERGSGKKGKGSGLTKNALEPSSPPSDEPTPAPVDSNASSAPEEEDPLAQAEDGMQRWVEDDDGHGHEHEHFHGHSHGHGHGHGNRHHRRGGTIVEDEQKRSHNDEVWVEHGGRPGYHHGSRSDVHYEDDGHDQGHGHEHDHFHGHGHHHRRGEIAEEDEQKKSHTDEIWVEDGGHHRHHSGYRHGDHEVYYEDDGEGHEHDHDHGHEHKHSHNHRRVINLLRPHYGSSPDGDLNVLSPIFAPLPPVQQLPPSTPAGPTGGSHRQPINSATAPAPPNHLPKLASPPPPSKTLPPPQSHGAGNINVLSPEYHSYATVGLPARPKWTPRGGRSFPLPYLLRARQGTNASDAEGSEGGGDGEQEQGGLLDESPKNSTDKTIGSGRGNFKHHAVGPGSNTTATTDPTSDRTDDDPLDDSPSRRSTSESVQANDEDPSISASSPTSSSPDTSQPEASEEEEGQQDPDEMDDGVKDQQAESDEEKRAERGNNDSMEMMKLKTEKYEGKGEEY